MSGSPDMWRDPAFVLRRALLVRSRRRGNRFSNYPTHQLTQLPICTIVLRNLRSILRLSTRLVIGDRLSRLKERNRSHAADLRQPPVEFLHVLLGPADAGELHLTLRGDQENGRHVGQPVGV